jgi:hypothetical protein
MTGQHSPLRGTLDKIIEGCGDRSGLAEEEEDISRLISIHQKYIKTGKEYNR